MPQKDSAEKAVRDIRRNAPGGQPGDGRARAQLAGVRSVRHDVGGRAGRGRGRWGREPTRLARGSVIASVDGEDLS